MIRDRKRLFESKNDTFDLEGIGKCTFDIDINNTQRPDFEIKQFDGWSSLEVEITIEGHINVFYGKKKVDLGDTDDDGNEYRGYVEDELQDYFRDKVSGDIYVDLDDDGDFTITYETEYEIESYVEDWVRDTFSEFDEWM